MRFSCRPILKIKAAGYTGLCYPYARLSAIIFQMKVIVSLVVFYKNFHLSSFSKGSSDLRHVGTIHFET